MNILKIASISIGPLSYVNLSVCRAENYKKVILRIKNMKNKIIALYLILTATNFAGLIDDAMTRIRIPSLYLSRTPIQKVVSTLNSISKDSDPQREGVNLVILEPDNVEYFVTVSVQNMSYRSALELILKGSGLEYHVENHFVIIQKTSFSNAENLFPYTAAGSANIEMASQNQKSAIYTIKIKDRVTTVTQTAYGTGFLAKIKGQYFVVTNLHVIRGVADPESIDIRDINGDRLKVGRVYGGVDHDLAILQVAAPSENTFAYEFDANTIDIKKGDGILVLGNPLGEGTILESKGRVIGVGPQKIEYDAATFSGNSGSPIIHIPTQKVIGIVTYISRMGLDNIFSQDAISKSDSPLSGTARRFGTRLDSIKNWEMIIWSEWVRQDREIYKFWMRLYSFKSLASASGISFDRQALMLTPELWKSYEKYEVDVAKSQSAEEYDNSVKRVLFSIDALVGATGGYINEIRKAKKDFYSFYQDELESMENEQIRFNELWMRNKIQLLHEIRVANAKKG